LYQYVTHNRTEQQERRNYFSSVAGPHNRIFTIFSLVIEINENTPGMKNNLVLSIILHHSGTKEMGILP